MFVPWVGERFDSEGPLASLRLLILGESHHAEEHEVQSSLLFLLRSCELLFRLVQRGLCVELFEHRRSS